MANPKLHTIEMQQFALEQKLSAYKFRRFSKGIYMLRIGLDRLFQPRLTIGLNYKQREFNIIYYLLDVFFPNGQSLTSIMKHVQHL